MTTDTARPATVVSFTDGTAETIATDHIEVDSQWVILVDPNANRVGRIMAAYPASHVSGVRRLDSRPAITVKIDASDALKTIEDAKVRINAAASSGAAGGAA